jgi:hypothetical protein
MPRRRRPTSHMPGFGPGKDAQLRPGRSDAAISARNPRPCRPDPVASCPSPRGRAARPTPARAASLSPRRKHGVTAQSRSAPSKVLPGAHSRPKAFRRCGKPLLWISRRSAHCTHGRGPRECPRRSERREVGEWSRSGRRTTRNRSKDVETPDSNAAARRRKRPGAAAGTIRPGPGASRPADHPRLGLDLAAVAQTRAPGGSTSSGIVRPGGDG